MRICFVTAELSPLAKTGGLADGTAGLAGYLIGAGHDVRVFLPFYAHIDTSDLDVQPVDFLQDIHVDAGGHAITMAVDTFRIPGTSHRGYLVRNPELYGRPGIYRQDGDEHVRFGLFARAVIESCQRMGWAPDVFHCHDWHTALLPVYLKTVYAWDERFASSRSLLTIHNIGYQGEFDRGVLQPLGLEAYAGRLPREDLDAGRVNFLRAGLVHADGISTVSRTYALEIQSDGFGMGLAGLLRHRSADLVGIVNGVDYSLWSPEHDRLIPQRYTAETIHRKRRDTQVLLERLGLPMAGDDVPVLGLVARLTSQKGIALIESSMTQLLSERDVRFVVLGSGEPRYEDFFRWLQGAFPGKACFWHGYNDELAHLIEAGSDMFLMPSHFEPCGLNQMYSMKYGTVPIVRKVGGLADTVEPWDARTRTGTGFVFEHYTADGLSWALGEAMTTFADRAAWETLMRNAMAKDFSWERQGPEYVALYARLAGK